MSISGGANVYPTDLEEVVAVHPAIAEFTVFGVPVSLSGIDAHVVPVLHQTTVNRLFGVVSLVGGATLLVYRVGPCSAPIAVDLSTTMTDVVADGGAQNGAAERIGISNHQWARRSGSVSGSDSRSWLRRRGLGLRAPCRLTTTQDSA
jgi:acyl-CoA synthetase (AMP-forming)/AMP-acid ligase II